MIAQLVLWMVMVYGLANILVYGKIFNGPRETIRRWGLNNNLIFSEFFYFLTDMLACIMCISVWLGFFFGIFLYSPVHEILGVSSWSSWFFDGFLASGAAWIINSIVEWFEENRPTK